MDPKRTEDVQGRCATENDEEELPKSLQKEIAFNRNKAHIAKLEALPMGLLLPTEYTAAEATEVGL